MKVFLSLGFKDRKWDDIDQDIAEMMDCFTEVYGYDNVEFIDNWDCVNPEGNNQKAWCLGEAIKKLGDCQAIILMYNWQLYKGCRVELEYAIQYGLDIFELVPENNVFKLKRYS